MLSPLPIHKSKSCPINFIPPSEEEEGSATTIATGAPVSNGYSATTMKMQTPSPRSSGSKLMTVNMSMTSPSASSTSTTKTSNGSSTRPRRRGKSDRPALLLAPTMPRSKKDPAQSIRYRLMNAKWMTNTKNKGSPASSSSSYTSLLIAVFLWYSLGVVSITTSNLLMMEPGNHIHHHDHQLLHHNNQQYYVGNVPPLYLTLQQLMIGTCLLRLLLHVGILGSKGVRPWPSPSATAKAAAVNQRKSLLFNNHKSPKASALSDLISSHLVLAGICFAMGFLATNSGFLASSAAFVETIKAAEPITSAAVAVAWRIESLSSSEVGSLGSIVTGVLISTLAHGSAKGGGGAASATLVQSLQSVMVVMTANLCFSFRGLYQKLFRATPEGSSAVIDDFNLQLRMQQIGFLLLVVPVIILDLPGIFSTVWQMSSEVGLLGSGIMFRYLALSIINGMAFTSYNLASTFILSRISVVHHAALNCIRRIFAIIVTSMIFKITITWMGIFGFCVSFGGFMSFTHFKLKRQQQPTPLSSLLPVSATPSLAAR